MLETPSITQTLGVVSVVAGLIATWVRLREKNDQHGKTLEEHGKSLNKLAILFRKLTSSHDKLTEIVKNHQRDIDRLIRLDDEERRDESKPGI